MKLNDADIQRGNTVVVKKLTVEVARGEILCVMGPSGAGKTSFLRCIAGFDALAAGTLHANITGKFIPTIFQEPRLLPWRDCLGNVMYIAGESAARKALAAVGLAHKAKDYPAQLSGGQRQRISIARALACQADLVLLDEPCAHLDAHTAVEIRQLIHTELQRSRTTAVWVTHDENEAAEVANQILHLSGVNGTWYLERTVTC